VHLEKNLTILAVPTNQETQMCGIFQSTSHIEYETMIITSWDNVVFTSSEGSLSCLHHCMLYWMNS